LQRQILRPAATIAHQHHEKFDGTGYPQGLRGEDIQLCARIVAVAHVFDALSHKRCYLDA
jgi:response regulator RpfG family c-di-GMP phosphodiesterase